jgi:phosphatidate cytidylyltransferase
MPPFDASALGGVVDPLSSPLLARVALMLGGLLGSALVVLRVAVRNRLTRAGLFVRWRTWFVIAPVFSLLVLAGPLPLAGLAAALGVQAAREYTSLAGLGGADRAVLLGAALAMPVACLVVPFGAPTLVLVLVLPLVATLPALLEQDAESGRPRVAGLAFGLLYVPVPLSLLVALDRTAGPGLVLSLALAVALSDVGAFTFGRLFGRRPLAPRLSPSKTWAGLAGNLVGAALGMTLLDPGASRWLLIPLVAVGAVWGDLLESLLKRSAGVKDTGAWLPGFGGLLDRLDSLLVVLPLVYALLELLP